MQQLAALEIIALSMAADAFSGTLNGPEKAILERRVRELTGLDERKDTPLGFETAREP